MTVRELLNALLDEDPTADVQLTGDGEHFFTIESLHRWTDEGVVGQIVPYPPELSTEKEG